MDTTKIPCFLCGQEIEVKNTVKGKPYFICDPCGLQAFIRRTKGAERLREWMEGKGEVFKKKSGGLILELITELEELKTKLGEIKDKRGIFPDEDSKLVISALEAEIGGIKNRIKLGLKKKNQLKS
jgi:hypothetical protein